MENQTHYYLICNDIKKGKQMPHHQEYVMESAGDYERALFDWKHKLQPCSITDVELEKVISQVYPFKDRFHFYNNPIPIDITDIVDELDYSSGEPNPIIYFKQPKSDETNKCSCLKCSPIEFPNIRFNVCSICGNKRCPYASDHEYKCTNSNDVGQLGSVYGKQIDSQIDYNLIALNILSNVEPKLKEKEEAFFISGFIECVKYFKDKKCTSIEFADWISENYFVSSSGLYHHNNWNGDMDTLINYTTKELYEIFLKEKNI